MLHQTDVPPGSTLKESQVLQAPPRTVTDRKGTFEGGRRMQIPQTVDGILMLGITHWPVRLSWLDHRPINQKAAHSIPSQGTCLGCGFNPWSGHREATDWCFSDLDVSLSLSSALSGINEYILEWGLKKKRITHLWGLCCWCGYPALHWLF